MLRFRLIARNANLAPENAGFLVRKASLIAAGLCRLTRLYGLTGFCRPVGFNSEPFKLAVRQFHPHPKKANAHLPLYACPLPVRRRRQAWRKSSAAFLVCILLISCQSSLEYQNPYRVASVTLEEPSPGDDSVAAIEKPDRDAPYPNSYFIRVDGARIHFRWIPSEGGRRKYVLIHGFAASTFSYRHTIEHLQKGGHEVVAIDLPGYGFSDRILSGSQSKFRRAEVVWEILDAISRHRQSRPGLSHNTGKMESADDTSSDSENRWILVGHSMGGSVIAAMAQLNPEAVDYLVFLAGSVQGGPGWFSRAAVSWIPGLQSLVIWYAESFKFNEESFADLLESAYARKPENHEVQGYLQPFLVPDTARSILSSIEDSGDTQSRSLELKDSSIPSLLIWGLKDSWVEPEVGRQLHSDLALSVLFTIPEAGHCPMETHPEKVHTLMEENHAVLMELRRTGPATTE
ncbi:MAG: hypothetical protein CMN76_07355 [Spirochaetaceae bacterium]|nr:hypothetical protein [Spirochaetaceae bacterium]|tara:strand:- start:128209 stop:129588 length:1380 start_codon:yes stop_codon:yes gene_type:complete